MIHYLQKCLKYIRKIMIPQNILVGGTSDNEYIKKLNKIKKQLDKKGYYFWFDKEETLLSKNVDKKLAKIKFLNKVKKTNSYDDKFIAIEISVDKNNIMNDNTGGLELIISIEKIKQRNNGLGTELIDDKNNIMRLYYRYDELDKFKLTDLKKIASMMLNKKIKKFSSLKYYHYEDIKKLI